MVCKECYEKLENKKCPVCRTEYHEQCVDADISFSSESEDCDIHLNVYWKKLIFFNTIMISKDE